MGIHRVQSLPSMKQLEMLAMELDTFEYDNDKTGTLEVNDNDLRSMTSQTSVEDILSLLSSKRNNHTVHGTNVYALMKAAADASGRELQTVKFEENDKVSDAERESDDMWNWTLEEEIDDIHCHSDEMDLWEWSADEKVLAMTAEQRIADMEEEQRIADMEASVPDADAMWDWSWTEPDTRDVDKLSALLWDWSWTPGRNDDTRATSPITSAQASAREALLWDWSWQRAEVPCSDAPAATFLGLHAIPEGAVVDDLWSGEASYDEKLADHLWDWRR